MKIIKVCLNNLPTVLDLIDEFDRASDSRPSKDKLLDILNQISEGGGAVLGAEIDGQIIGTCTVVICPNLSRSGRPYAMIENVVVARGSRLQGVGKALMKEADSMAREAGCYKIALMTGANREESFKFYESCSFIRNKVGFQRKFDD